MLATTFARLRDPRFHRARQQIVSPIDSLSIRRRAGKLPGDCKIPKRAWYNVAMMKNRSVPCDTVLPHVVYQDVASALAWLTAVFGFAEHYRYGEPVQG